jgi:hypothetical protein
VYQQLPGRLHHFKHVLIGNIKTKISVYRLLILLPGRVLSSCKLNPKEITVIACSMKKEWPNSQISQNKTRIRNLS